MYSLCKIKW